jgi:tetratricopeptide (TPR) repeat protein
MAYNNNSVNQAELQRAEELFRIAIDYDSSFLLPYINLSWIYINRQIEEIENSTAMLDSVQKYLKLIFKYNTLPVQSYTLLGYYYMARGRMDKALESFQMVLRYDPYNAGAYRGLAVLCQRRFDFVGTIENYHIALVHSDPGESENIYRNLSLAYLFSGCRKQVYTYSARLLELNGDSATYFAQLGAAEYVISNNIPAALEMLHQGYAIDPGNLMILKNLGEIYLELGQVEQSLQWFHRYSRQLNSCNQIDLYGTHVIGYAYLLDGNLKEANYYFDCQLKYCDKLLTSHQNASCQFAMISAWKGNREEAIEYLKEYNTLDKTNVYVVRNFKNNLFFRNIQEEPEFIAIKDDLIKKYQAEHERVLQWLDRNGLS